MIFSLMMWYFAVTVFNGIGIVRAKNTVIITLFLAQTINVILEAKSNF